MTWTINSSKSYDTSKASRAEMTALCTRKTFGDMSVEVKESCWLIMVFHRKLSLTMSPLSQVRSFVPSCLTMVVLAEVIDCILWTSNHFECVSRGLETCPRKGPAKSEWIPLHGWDGLLTDYTCFTIIALNVCIISWPPKVGMCHRFYLTDSKMSVVHVAHLSEVDGLK